MVGVRKNSKNSKKMRIKRITRKTRKMRKMRKMHNKTRTKRGGGGMFSCMGAECTVSPEERNAKIILKSLKRLEFNSYDDILFATELEKLRAMRGELEGVLADFVDLLLTGFSISHRLNYLYLKIKRNNDTPLDSDIERLEALKLEKIRFQEMSDRILNDDLINPLIPIPHCINVINHIEKSLIAIPLLKIYEIIERNKPSVTIRHQTQPRRV